MQVHHIGYLVKSIPESLSAFSCLGYTPLGEVIWDPARNTNICFLENGPYRLELIAPSEHSVLYSLMKTHKNTPYHICYCCNNLEAAILSLKSQKYMLFSEPAPALAISASARVAFLIHAKAGIIELVEE